MADAGKYGIIDIIGIPREEPVFVLRAKDRTSAQAIQLYRHACFAAGASPEHLEGVDDAVKDFLFWQESHDTKIPGRQ